MNTETTGTNGVKGSYTTNVPHIPKDISKMPGTDLVPKMATANFVQTIPTTNDTGSFSFTTTTQTQPLPLKLYAKIHKIIKDGIRIGKNGRNDFHKYDYVTEADVVDEMKRIFTENNIVYDFSIIGVQPVTGLDNVTLVEAEITLIDLDSSESRVYSFFGQGQDKGDKGIYKAYTGLQKYFFMKNFLISTGDDPENDSGKANVAVAKTTTTTTAKKNAFVAPTRTIAPAPTTQTAPNTTNALTATTDAIGSLSGTVSLSVPTTVTPIGVTVTADTKPTDPVVTAAPTETTPVVKKPRGTFNPPKRVVKPAREE